MVQTEILVGMPASVLSLFALKDPMEILKRCTARIIFLSWRFVGFFGLPGFLTRFSKTLQLISLFMCWYTVALLNCGKRLMIWLQENPLSWCRYCIWIGLSLVTYILFFILVNSEKKYVAFIISKYEVRTPFIVQTIMFTFNNHFKACILLNFWVFLGSSCKFCQSQR